MAMPEPRMRSEAAVSSIPRRLVIVTHERVKGPAQELLDWALAEGLPDVAFIGHPLYRGAGLRSTCAHWKLGRKVAARRGPPEPGLEALRYILHWALSTY